MKIKTGLICDLVPRLGKKLDEVELEELGYIFEILDYCIMDSDEDRLEALWTELDGMLRNHSLRGKDKQELDNLLGTYVTDVRNLILKGN